MCHLGQCCFHQCHLGQCCLQAPQACSPGQLEDALPQQALVDGHLGSNSLQRQRLDGANNS